MHPLLSSQNGNVRLVGCEICNRIEMCRSGTSPYLVAELETGFVVLGDSQFFEGYCLLLFNEHAEHLDELDGPTQTKFLAEMARTGAAVREATGCDRVNYELLGNTLSHLHWHIVPRRSTDPAPTKPIWTQKPTDYALAPHAFDENRHGELQKRLRHLLAS